MSARGKYPRNWIKELRIEREWSQRELAEKAGFPHHQTINNLENSIAELKHTQLIKLAAAFDCHPLDITDGPGHMTVAKDDKEAALLKFYRSMSDQTQMEFISYAAARSDLTTLEQMNLLFGKEKIKDFIETSPKTTHSKKDKP